MPVQRMMQLERKFSMIGFISTLPFAVPCLPSCPRSSRKRRSLKSDDPPATIDAKGEIVGYGVASLGLLYLVCSLHGLGLSIHLNY